MTPGYRYSIVAAEGDVEEDNCTTSLEKKAHHPFKSLTWHVFSPIAWLFTSFLFISVLILLVAAITKEPTSEQCARKLSVWSPALEAVEYVDIQFQNKFNEKSIYRGKPTPELEKAWLDLWNFGPVNIPLDKLNILNKSREVDWKRVNPKAGGGIIGNLEVFHQIHCLDLIRQYTYRDEYDYSKQPAFDGTPQQVREHVDHCINSLLIFLKCTSDVTPYLMLSDERRPLGIDADFNTQHKCRNFEKIWKWAGEHELNTEEYQNEIS